MKTKRLLRLLVLLVLTLTVAAPQAQAAQQFLFDAIQFGAK